jgi:two-component system sensor histidine kinase KdpD
VQSEQLRNSLLNSISHDLRTPLSTIAVTASTLLDEATNTDEAARREGLQTVVHESRRLGRQVENLLEMARLDSGVIRANAEWEAVEELIEASLARLQRELEGRTIHVQIDKDVPPLWVAGELMEKVFVNLLENAARYARLDSVIEITGVNCGEHVEIVVTDDGPGLPAGAEAKVFEKYFRGPLAVDDGQRGIGLGLAICRSIIEAHGGLICAANRPSGGAMFTISLPCEQPSPTEMPAHASVDS